MIKREDRKKDENNNSKKIKRKGKIQNCNQTRNLHGIDFGLPKWVELRLARPKEPTKYVHVKIMN